MDEVESIISAARFAKLMAGGVAVILPHIRLRWGGSLNFC